MSSNHNPELPSIVFDLDELSLLAHVLSPLSEHNPDDAHRHSAKMSAIELASRAAEARKENAGIKAEMELLRIKYRAHDLNATRFSNLDNIMGTTLNDSQRTVILSQDDATHDYCVRVEHFLGNTKYFGKTLGEAVDAASRQESD